MVGSRLRIVIVKVWHAGAVTPLLAQTVVGPYDPAVVGAPLRKPWGVSVSPGGRAPFVTENVGSGEKPMAVN